MFPPFKRKPPVSPSAPAIERGFSLPDFIKDQAPLGNAVEVAGMAERLLKDPLLQRLFDGLEADAIDACVYTDDEFTREARAAEVRAIRALRQKLNALLSEANLPRRGAPA